ncbi:MAG: hypothetical protein ACHQ49_01840 [Elusimicrobiota bacterium]
MAELTVRFELSFGTRGLRSLMAAAMVCAGVTEVASESMTLTTYYPAPSGVYLQMITTGNTYLARDGGQVGIGVQSFSAAAPYFMQTYDSLDLYGGTNPATPYNYLRIGAPYASQSSIAFSDGKNGEDSVIYRPGSTQDLAFWTHAVGDVLYITQAGSVGIGTDNPGAKLDVEGKVRIVDGTQAAGLVLGSDAAGNASWGFATYAP